MGHDGSNRRLAACGHSTVLIRCVCVRYYSPFPRGKGYCQRNAHGISDPCMAHQPANTNNNACTDEHEQSTRVPVSYPSSLTQCLPSTQEKAWMWLEKTCVPKAKWGWQGMQIVVWSATSVHARTLESLLAPKRCYAKFSPCPQHHRDPSCHHAAGQSTVLHEGQSLCRISAHA